MTRPTLAGTRHTGRFLVSLLGLSLRASVALRGAFLLQALFMVLNNLIFFTTWWIFFARFPEVGGWKLSDLAVLFGIVAAGFGIAGVCAGGVHSLARRITDGDLDGFLTQPKSVLLQGIGCQSRPSAWGDIASGVLLIAISGRVSPAEIPVAVWAVLLSGTTLLATAIVIHSSAFWIERIQSMSQMLTDFVITFSSYPPAIFSGGLRLVLFTLVPAGFVGYLPAALVREFSWSTLLVATAGTATYVGVAVGLFACGLRRYESGSRFGVHA